MDGIETLLTVCLGIGLSAACGFRIFVPMLVLSIATRSGHVELATGFDWIGSTPALITFSVATVLEIGAYYIPWLDNLLDSIASPIAVVAGTVVTASVLTDVSPLMQWTMAIIAGGGAAAAVQATTVVTRGASSAGTGGLGNPVVATAELGGSLFMSVLSVFLPLLAVGLAVGVVGFAGYKYNSRKNASKTVEPEQLTS
ncbi:MAG: hypothetical protein ACI9VS_003872 [Candidatus Binatia bacterium]|jgi:hypothetical protein